MILMLIKYQSLKKINMANIIHLNTLLGIMIMIWKKIEKLMKIDFNMINDDK